MKTLPEIPVGIERARTEPQGHDMNLSNWGSSFNQIEQCRPGNCMPPEPPGLTLGENPRLTLPKL
jgi:hypothetical protein